MLSLMEKEERLYTEEDQTNPVNVYMVGQKLERRNFCIKEKEKSGISNQYLWNQSTEKSRALGNGSINH